MIPLIITIFVGIVIGYLGQRSRFCVVSGIRDYYLLKNTDRLKGFFGVIIGATLGFIVFQFIGGDVPDFPIGMDIKTTGYLIATIIGGVGMGFYSILAEGCPFRQHVIAAQGRESAIFYLVGFYIGIAYFYLVTINYLEAMLIGIG